ncbi:hypothetical protein ACH4NT_36780 [Streptomyces lydicus]|uniref:hypothetical protein n=1 Tax=Streptomyces lydicus TaxID=47763 RepID=UPI0037BAA506
MTTDTPAPASTAPNDLSPRDESRVALARTAYLLARRAHDAMSTDPDAQPGDLLRQALDVERRARELVERAVIAEREGGTTWEQIAGAAGTTKQAAHERWSGEVKAWAALGRVIGEARPTMELARELDANFAQIDVRPRRTDAVSAGLDATRHPGSAAFEDARRTRGQQLHARLEELKQDGKRNAEEYERLREPSDRDGWLRLAANLTATADREAAIAQVYEELTGAEPALADEHRASAEQYRGYVDSSRDYADLALKRAGEL